MKIANGTVVYIHYTLTNDAGQIMDSSEGTDPLAYIQGMGNVIPGLERALDGCVTGDKFSVSIDPEDAYGTFDEALIHSVPRSAFGDIEAIEAGMRFQTRAPDGGMMVLTVSQVANDLVTLDGNHPLAGQRLTFAVEVTAVRAATPTEIEHGHVHDGDDHHH